MARLYDSDRDMRRAAGEAITEALGPGCGRGRSCSTRSSRTSRSTTGCAATRPGSRPATSRTRRPTRPSQALVDAADLALRGGPAVLPPQGAAARARPPRALRPLRAGRDGHGEDSWEDARRIVVDAYTEFSDEAGDIVARFFDDRWIDGPVRPDKRTGAFCATTVPGVHPYVLMNYTGDRRSILTLAHELGHGLHGVLAQPLGLFNASTPLTTAETASVFGEALTFELLLADEDDPRRRLDLLTGRIEDAIATTFRQIAMNRFEHAVHTERREQGELASERIGELWLEAQNALFGDSVSTEGYTPWWSYIPHFTGTPGYVYAYAYGYLFSLAIYRKYQQEGDSMVEPYLELLRSGGSRSPEELAPMVGLDLTDPAIWASGIDALSDELDEAERLAAEIGLG